MSYGKSHIDILYENSFCLVLNKPSGLAVQGGKGIKVSLDSILAEKIKPRPFLVHRLDRDTSGIILVAKTKASAALFPKLRAEKRYLTLCLNKLNPPLGLIELSLDGKASKTSYRTLGSVVSDDFAVSLVELTLGTGRMHQIRRHLAMTDCPVLGDDKYGDFSLNKNLRKTKGLKNLLLHACRLVINPSPGLAPEGLDLNAPLPEHFSGFLNKINFPAGLPETAFLESDENFA